METSNVAVVTESERLDTLGATWRSREKTGKSGWTQYNKA